MATYQFAQIKAPPASAPASKAPAGKPAPKKPASSSSGSSSDFNKKHPRGSAGSGKGGQFVALSYDSKSNTGTGYGTKQGDSRVKKLQTSLNRLGLKDKHGNRLKIDGKLGPLTTSSVIAAQKKLGIKPADGKVTPALLAKLTGAKTLSSGKKPTGTHKKSHLARGKKKLKPAAKTKTKPPPPRKLMPWEKAHRPPPANYRPNPAEPR